MKRTSAELKRIAREHLQGHYGLPIGATVVTTLITSVLLVPFYTIYQLNQTNGSVVIYQIANIIVSLISAILSSGLIRIHLKLARGEQPVFSDLFYCFTKRPDRFILAALLILAITFLCLLPGCICLILYGVTYSAPLGILGILLLVGSIVAAVMIELLFALVYTLLADNDSMGVMEAFRTSRQLMQGNKGRLFYIDLSFLGWALLALLTCGIGYLWLSPYMMQTSVEFYRDVTGELDRMQGENVSYSQTGNFYSEHTGNFYEQQNNEYVNSDYPENTTFHE